MNGANDLLYFFPDVSKAELFGEEGNDLGHGSCHRLLHVVGGVGELACGDVGDGFDDRIEQGLELFGLFDEVDDGLVDRLNGLNDGTNRIEERGKLDDGDGDDLGDDPALEALKNGVDEVVRFLDDHLPDHRKALGLHDLHEEVEAAFEEGNGVFPEHLDHLQAKVVIGKAEDLQNETDDLGQPDLAR